MAEFSYVRTYMGRHVALPDPDPATIELEDIAHALAHICRFNGHTRRFYSVAEHCVVGARQFKSPAYAATFLMHDAAEAYLPDVPRPAKALLPDYRRLEDRVFRAIIRRFELDRHDIIVHRMDARMLATEAAQLFDAPSIDWLCPSPPDPLDVVLECWEPQEAKQAFLMTARLVMR